MCCIYLFPKFTYLGWEHGAEKKADPLNPIDFRWKFLGDAC